MKVNPTGVLTFKRDVIIKALKANAAEHKIDYKKAVDQYYIDADQLLREQLDLVANKKKLNLHFNLPLPQDRSKLYDNVINFYEQSVEEEFALTKAEFDNIFNDEWDWMQAAKTSNAFYTSRS
jgi:hypothetical protein